MTEYVMFLLCVYIGIHTNMYMIQRDAEGNEWVRIQSANDPGQDMYIPRAGDTPESGLVPHEGMCV